MHPGMFAWWHARRHAACGDSGCGEAVGCGPEGGRGGGPWGWHASGGGGSSGDDFGAPAFGVRRPLRFLSFKLDLDEAQTTELAAILADLKTERAQGAVDHRRTVGTLADSLTGDAFDETKAKAAADDRVKTTERVEAAVVKALGRIHALLRGEQRARLAYLLRTGALTI